MFCRGDVVTIGNDVGIVVFMGSELPGDMSDHTGVWFGKVENGILEVKTIPTEYLRQGPKPTLVH